MALVEMKWQDATLAERQAVVDMYNKHYANTGTITFEQADAAWTDSRWITIKYTFGIEPF